MKSPKGFLERGGFSWKCEQWCRGPLLICPHVTVACLITTEKILGGVALFSGNVASGFYSLCVSY